MGSKILYYLLILPISYLPYPLLYLLSDFVYIILYYIVGYRKKVVFKNIANSFPEKSEKEVVQISKKFYRHFTDLIVEAFKNFSISEKSASKRVISKGHELMNQYQKEGRDVVISGGHYNNWELWAVAASMSLDHQLIGIYKRLSNAYFDQKMRSSRGKFGMDLVSTKRSRKYIEERIGKGIAPIFAIDQSPADPKKSYWIEFLNQETACFFGLEKYSKEFDLPVFYGKMTKLKRGFYEIEYELITESPRDCVEGEIIKKTHEMLEKQIRDKPEFWLWTHKRWKHKRPQSN